MSGLGLRALSIYNPGGLNDEVLRSAYLARPQLLADLLALLRGIDRDSVATHQLVIGQRGMGKTTLLHRLALAVREEPELEARLLPLTFPEEQYSVGSLKDFWRNCLDALIDTIEARKLGDFSALQAQQDRLEQADQDADAVLTVLLAAQQQYQRRLLLLVDNLDMLFERLDERESWSLRATLQQPGGPVLFAAATHAPEDGFRYDRAFYDFLSIRWLEALQFDEVRTLLDQLAQRHDNEALRTELARNPQRLIPLQLFTGGNPRTVVLLFRVLAQGLDEGVQKDVEDLLDLSTPLYKARIEALPLQQQRVFIAVALAFDPVTAAQVETQLKLGINTVSAQLNKLLKSGLLRHGPSAGKRLSFEVAERFFNIWYLMRTNRRERHRMLWLARFLRNWYLNEPAQLANAAERLLDSDHRKAVAFAVLEMTSGIPEADTLRLKAARRLSDAEQAMYPDLISKQLRESAGEAVGQALALSEDADHWQVAEAMYNHAIKIDETYALPWYYRGRFLSKLPGQQNSAEESFRQAILLDPADAMTWYELGSLLQLNSDRRDETEEAFRNAVSIDPDFFLYWCALGDLLSADPERWGEAEKAYRRATELDGENWTCWFGLGQMLSQDPDRWAEAEVAFTRAARIEPSIAIIWNHLGCLLAQQSTRAVDAESAYLRSIELDPTNETDWANLSDLWSSTVGTTDFSRIFSAAGRRTEPPRALESLLKPLIQSRLLELRHALLASGYGATLMDQARPLAEAIEMLATDNPQSIATLAAEVRESTYLVLKRMAPAFAERIAREHPALVASFTLPSEITPLQTGAS